MTVQAVHQKLGQWSIRLRPDTPAGVLNALDYFGRVAIVPGRVNPVERGDELLTLARYVGVLRSITGDTAVTLGGVSMAFWLGDENGVGDCFENPGVTVTGATFAAAVRAVLPPNGGVLEGTLYSGVSGTITNTFVYQTPRTAVDYVCSTMGGEWRVNGDGTLDAGPAASLFRATPQAIVARKDVSGYDMGVRALPGNMTTTLDAKDYTTRVVLVAQALAGGTADAGTVPYKDPHGNPVHLTRIVDETDETTVANAGARAASLLAAYSGPRRSVRLSVDEFDVAGDISPGDTVWVYDPDNGLADTGNEVPFRGRLLNPTAVRVLSLTWPVSEGYTVGFRDGLGAWTDLTPWVAWEAPSGGEVEVADTAATALTSGISTIGTAVAGGGGGAGDTAVPDVPTFGTFTGTSYQPADGLSRAAVKVTWTQPLNTDASTIVDGDHYEVRYRPSGTSDWQIAYAPFDQTSLTVTNLPPSTGFDWQIRAVDYASPVNYGAWSATTTYSTPADTTAPATPAPPTVAASQLAVQVKHTLGLASGGTYNLPLDMDHLEIHVGTVTGFTPSTATLIGKLQATGAMVTGTIPAVGTFEVDTLVTAGTAAFVKVIAVDKTGNRSTASSAASATAQLIDSAHISDLTASKITAGTMSAAVILGGSIKTGTSGSRVESDSTGIRLYDSGGSVVVNLNASTGAATFSGALSAATGTFAGSLSAATGTFSGALSGATGTFSGNLTGATVTGGVVQTAFSGGRIVLDSSNAQRISLYDSGGGSSYIQAQNVYGSNEIGVYSGSGSSFMYANNFSCTINGSSGVVSASSSGWTAQSTSGTAYASGSGSTVNLEASSQINIGASAGGSITIGSAFGGQMALASSTINLSNIPGSSGTSIALKMVSRQLQFVSSTRASKVDIRDAEITAADALKLRPVSYYARDEVDAQDGVAEGLTRHFGFIAEEVDEIPAARPLVIRDDDGSVMSLGYDRVPALQQVVLRDHETRLAALAERLAALEASA